MSQSPAGMPPSETSLLPLITGHMASQVIFVTAKLSLADLIAEDCQSVAALADRTQTDASALERLLRTLVSLGLLDETDPGRFVLTSLGTQLRTGVPGSVRNLALMFCSERSWRSWGDLLYSVQTGESAAQRIYGVNGFEYFAVNPELAAVFNEAMAENTRRVGQAVAAGYDFSAFRTLVDVGGGNGALLAIILAAFPTLRGIVFDLPSGMNGVHQCLDAAGVAGRCTVTEGDFFRDVPAGADAYMLKNVIHDWGDDRGVAILRSCRTAMPVHAKLLLMERLMPPKIAAIPAHRQIALMDINMLVMPGGRQRTEPELKALLASSGFRWNVTLPLGRESAYSLIEAAPA